MKKVLLATAATIAMSGTAFAGGHIAMSGNASFGIFNDEASGDNNRVWSNAGIDFAMTGMTTSGWEFGATVSGDAGTEVDLGDFEFDGADEGHWSFDGVFISYGGFKFTADVDDIDDLYDDDEASHDVQLDYVVGAFTLNATWSDDAGAGDSEFSYHVAYSENGISASVTGNDEDDSIKATVGYTQDMVFGVSLEADQGGPGGDAVLTLAGHAYAGPAKINVEIADDETWEFGIDYSEGNVSVSVSTDDANEWELSGAYDLGGGASAVAGVNFR